MGELNLLKAKSPVLSTNLRLRRDGLPYSDQRKPDDPGVAVYFTRQEQQLCFACDRWDRVEDNIVAVAKTIEALRGIDRWGTGEMIRAAFTGFAAIAATPARQAWWVVLGCEESTDPEAVEARYLRLCREVHPDRGGDTAQMAEINQAYADFQRGH